MNCLQARLANSKHGSYAFTGSDRNIWKDGEDLLVTCPDHLNDSFTRLLLIRFIEAYHKFINSRFRQPSDEENGMYKYDEKSVLRAADILGTLIARLLPVVAVVVLYTMHDMWARLGMVALFTVLLSLALVIITKARRIEIFAATAVYVSPVSSNDL